MRLSWLLLLFALLSWSVPAEAKHAKRHHAHKRHKSHHRKHAR